MFDLETTEATATHVYSTAFDDFVILRVTSPGGTALASARTVVNANGFVSQGDEHPCELDENGVSIIVDEEGKFIPCTADHLPEVDQDGVMEITGISMDATGVFRPGNGLLYLKNSNDTGFADMASELRPAGRLSCGWRLGWEWYNTIGVYRNGYFYLKNANTHGLCGCCLPLWYKRAISRLPETGTAMVSTPIGVYRPSIGQFLLRNSNSEGTADASFYLGNLGRCGDCRRLEWRWTGHDRRLPSEQWDHLPEGCERYRLCRCGLNYGLPGDKPVTGDWDGDGDDTIGIYRNGSFSLRNETQTALQTIVFGLGRPG